jgi:hypothetical protein
MSSTVNNEACASFSSPRISSLCQVGLGQGLGEDDLCVAIPQFPDCMGRQSAAVVCKCLSAWGSPAKKGGTWLKNSEELSLSSETFWIRTDFSVSFCSSVHSRVMISFSSHHKLPFTTETNFWLFTCTNLSGQICINPKSSPWRDRNVTCPSFIFGTYCLISNLSANKEIKITLFTVLSS